MKKLKECPFCGGVANRSESWLHGLLGAGSVIRQYYCRCTVCGVRTADFKTKKGAENAWNRRKEKTADATTSTAKG